MEVAEGPVAVGEADLAVVPVVDLSAEAVIAMEADLGVEVDPVAAADRADLVEVVDRHRAVLFVSKQSKYMLIIFRAVGPGRDGDWRCSESSCGNMNFAWRSECNRCKTPRSDLTGGPGPQSGGASSGDYGWFY